MTTNIFTVNIRNLEEKLHDFEILTNTVPYIICCKDTADIIAQSCGDFKFNNNKCRESGLISKYRGNTILLDDSLKLGIVEIR